MFAIADVASVALDEDEEILYVAEVSSRVELRLLWWLRAIAKRKSSPEKSLETMKSCPPRCRVLTSTVSVLALDSSICVTTPPGRCG